MTVALPGINDLSVETFSLALEVKLEQTFVWQFDFCWS